MEGDVEREREEAEAHAFGTSMRLIELDGRREGPVDHGECKDLLRVSCHFSRLFFPFP